MTVKELIEKLESIEDKEMAIFAKLFEGGPDEAQDRITELEVIHAGDLNYVLLH